MKILLVHNEYQERGGEDSVLEAERDMLADNGVQVATHLSTNHEINSLGGRIRAFAQVANNPAEVAGIMAKVREGHFDLVHVHNFLPLISPAFHEAVAAAGLPVVQTLHNYRLLCGVPRQHLWPRFEVVI